MSRLLMLALLVVIVLAIEACAGPTAPGFTPSCSDCGTVVPPLRVRARADTLSPAPR